MGTTGYGLGGAIFVLDLGGIKRRPMRNRDTKLLPNRQGNGEDKVVFDYLTEMSVEIKNETTHGVFYGVTAYGGDHGACTIFRITATGALATLFDFEDGGLAPSGNQPVGGLVRGADGALYVVAMSGVVTTSGVGGGGVFFLITTAVEFSVLHSFCFDD